jgi:hypothetical protein
MVGLLAYQCISRYQLINRRKGDDGTVLCNACGLYWKIHKEHRPLEGSRKRKRPSTGAESPTSSPPVTTVHQAFSATQQQRQQQQSPLIAMNYSKLLLAIQQQQQKNFHS